MKRIFFLFFIFLLIPFFAFSYSLDLLIGNDNVTYGLSRNDDDGLSFGARLSFESNNHTANLALKSYTSRGYYLEDGEIIKGRFDEIQLDYGYKLEFNIAPSFTFTLHPSIGVGSVGNFGFDWVQNTFHRIIGKAPVSLPYDYDKAFFLPSFGLDAEAGYSVSFLTAFLSNNTSYSPGYGVINTILAGLDVDDFMSFSVGYNLTKSFEQEYNTHYVQAVKTTGWVFESQLHAGLVEIQYTTNIPNSISYGLIGVNVLELFQKNETFENHGLGVHLGSEFGHPSRMNRQAISLYNLFFSIRYQNGEIIAGTQKRISNSSFIFGYRFPFEIKSSIITPFVSPFAGIGRYYYYSIEQGNSITEYVNAVRPVIGLDAGINIGSIIINDKRYSVDLGLTAAYTMASKSILVPEEHKEFRGKISILRA